MSRYGMQAGGESVFGIKNPLKAIDLIKKVVQQWNGELWTQHRPHCPLCNEELKDCERHMNQPVGECDNPKCESRIYAADYIGKITDILDEWLAEQSDWVDEMEKKVKRAQPVKTFSPRGGQQHKAHKNLNAHSVGANQFADIDEEEIFIW